MTALRVHRDAVGVVFGLDAGIYLEGLEVEGYRFARLSVIGVSLAHGVDDSDAMAAPGHAFHAAEDGPGVAVQNVYAISMRDIEPPRILIEGEIIPAIGRTDRNGLAGPVGEG